MDSSVQIRVLVISRTEKQDGASIAANRLGEAAVKHNIIINHLSMLSLRKSPKIQQRLLHFLIRLENHFERIVSSLTYSHKVGEGKYPIPILSTLFLGNHLLGSSYFDEYDVVHIHDMYGSPAKSLNLGRLRKQCKIICTLHDTWLFSSYYTYSGSYKPSLSIVRRKNNTIELMLKYLEKLYKTGVLGCIDSFISPSTWMSSLFTGQTRLESLVLNNPLSSLYYSQIDFQRSRSKVDSISMTRSNVLFGAANLADPRKNFKKYLELAQLCKAKQCTFNFKAFGSFKSLSKETLVKSTQFVDLLGPIKDEYQLIQLFISSDIFVFTSVIDNYPQVLAEAYACGCHIIAIDVGGVSEIFSGSMLGVELVSSDRITDFYECLQKLLLCSADRSDLLVARKNFLLSNSIGKDYRSLLFDLVSPS